MSKSRVSNCTRDETVRSEISFGGNVTTNDGVALPNYLVHLPSHNDGIVDIDVVEELNYRGNDGYSDDVGDYAR